MAQESGSFLRPPDPHGAAGPGGIIQVVNLRIAYWNRDGDLNWGPVNFTTFFSSVGISSSQIADPRAIYDTATGRFYVILQQNLSTESYCYVAASRNNNPASAGTADWHFYRFTMTEVVGTTRYGGDYPGLGVDGQAVYVTYNMYQLPLSGLPLNCQILIMNKAALNNGTATTFTPVFTPNGSANGFTLQPATPLVGNPGNVAFFGETRLDSTTLVRAWALNDPLGTPTLTSASVTVPNHGGFISGAPQSGTTQTLPTVSPRTQGNAFYNNGAIWFCHTAGGGSGRSIVYYYRVNLNGFPSGTPTLGESGNIDGGTGVWTFQPSIGGNARGDVAIVFSQSSASTVPSIRFTYRAATATSFPVPLELMTSPTYANIDRWGDYGTVAADPLDGSFWISHQYARTTTFADWGTWWGNIFIPGSLDPFFDPGTGANNNIYATAVQTDGKVLIGGAFTTVNGVSRTYVARLNANGSLDTGFIPSTLNGNIYTLAIQADGKIIVGGDFTTVGAQAYKRVARLSTSGTVDTTFNPGTGANWSVNVVTVQSDGKILAGGSFTTFNGVTRNYLVRLNSNGSVDTGYTPSLSSYVYSLAIQTDGKHIIGGDVNLVTGTYHRDGCARLLTSGVLDTTFSGATFDGPVLALGLQSDGKAVTGGGFSSINGNTSYKAIGRLTTAGALDTSFTPGTGANSTVYALTLQPDGRVLIGGYFTSYNGQTRNRIARLNTSGTLDTYFDPGTGPNDVVWSTSLRTGDGTLVIGGGFTQVNGTARNRIAGVYGY